MVGATSGVHQNWSSRMTFILATVGFSVGLGNIWRFPYLAGQNGGGAFVLIYMGCVLLIGIPIVMAELAIGRRGGKTPAATMGLIAARQNKSPIWAWAGGLAMLTGFLIVTYYSVIGGWTLHYVALGSTGALNNIDGETSGAIYKALLSNPWKLVFWQFVFLAINVAIVSRGLKGGIERAVTILMPTLFILLIALAIYGLIAGDAAQGLSFLFRPDFSQVTGQTFLDAMGQAFFSVGVGMAAMMTYGAYLPKTVNIPQTASIIAFADTSVALIAGMAIFPFVFALGLSPSEGPGLVFVTLPAALANLSGGGIAITAFFILLAVAALTSSIALFEVVSSWGEERGWSRQPTIIITAILCFIIGLLTVFSLNIASEFHPMSYIPGYETATMFGVLDRLTATVGLPLGGLFVALFAGWIMSRKSIALELSLDAEGLVFRTWSFLVRWPLPLVITALLIGGVTE